MAVWAKRTICGLLAAAVLLGCGLHWLRSELPDTFRVEEGRPLALAQTPWLQPLLRTGARSAGAGEPDSSCNAVLSLWGVLPVKQVRCVTVERRTVQVCGMPFGIKMFSDGALVVGFTDIRTEQGYVNPAKEAGLKLGDLVLSINGRPTRSNEDVMAAIRRSGGKPVPLAYSRNGVKNTATLCPVQDVTEEQLRAGMWVRDSSAGIGTLTFVDREQGVYGGLGHSISDADTGERIALRSGEIVPVSITGYVRGSSGDPGELKGKFTSTIALGDIRKNGPTGVYGTLRTELPGREYPAALAQEVHTGPAVMLTTIAGTEPQAYQVEIERVSLSADSPNRNMVIRVRDDALLRATGGIVQGMSGSPIIQNGRLVGAVTHVLVNDPTRGYGIFIENMLEAAG